MLKTWPRQRVHLWHICLFTLEKMSELSDARKESGKSSRIRNCWCSRRCVCSNVAMDVCRCWKLGPDRLCRAGRWVPRQAMVKHASLDHCSLAALPSSSSSTASSLSTLGPSGTSWQAGLHGVNVEIQEGSVHFGLSLRQNGCCGPFVHETRDSTWYEQIFGNFVGKMAEGPNR